MPSDHIARTRAARDDGRDAMRRRIHEMMDGASEKDREALRRCLDAMS